ncbi:DUF502 domain-containing protein [bacterium]|nr:DUF502 domain-containing protein [bacterium]
MKSLKRIFLSGLIFIVPASLSVWILYRVILFFENILGFFLKKHIPEIYIPGAGFFLLIVLILLIGFLADNFLGKKILYILEKFFETMPLLNKIYTFIKEISSNLFHGGKSVFKEAVRIEFFSGTYTVGFVTGQSSIKGYISVFVPTVPNISTGFYLLVPENKIEKLDIPVEEAIKTVISMGIFGPENGADKDRSDNFKKE